MKREQEKNNKKKRDRKFQMLNKKLGVEKDDKESKKRSDSSKAMRPGGKRPISSFGMSNRFRSQSKRPQTGLVCSTGDQSEHIVPGPGKYPLIDDWSKPVYGTNKMQEIIKNNEEKKEKSRRKKKIRRGKSKSISQKRIENRIRPMSCISTGPKRSIYQ